VAARRGEQPCTVLARLCRKLWEDLPRIPYAWGLATQSSDSYEHLLRGTAGTTGLPQRTSSLSPLDTRKVPANGAITALTANVTL